MWRLLVPEWRCMKVEGGREEGGLNTSSLNTQTSGHCWRLSKVFVFDWLKNRSSQLGSRRASGSRSRGQGSTSSGTMVRMTSSLPRLTTVRSVSSRLMAALTSLAEVTGSPLMLMMTSLSRRPALSQQKSEGGKKAKEMSNFDFLENKIQQSIFCMISNEKETLVHSLVVLVLAYLIQFKTHLGQIFLNWRYTVANGAISITPQLGSIK